MEKINGQNSCYEDSHLEQCTESAKLKKYRRSGKFTDYENQDQFYIFQLKLILGKYYQQFLILLEHQENLKDLDLVTKGSEDEHTVKTRMLGQVFFPILIKQIKNFQMAYNFCIWVVSKVLQ